MNINHFRIQFVHKQVYKVLRCYTTNTDLNMMYYLKPPSDIENCDLSILDPEEHLSKL